MKFARNGGLNSFAVYGLCSGTYLYFFHYKPTALKTALLKSLYELRLPQDALRWLMFRTEMVANERGHVVANTLQRTAIMH